MIQIRRHAIVRHTPARMFDLVNDVEAYPTHFRWCAGAHVLERDGDSALTARLDLRFAGLSHSFTTRNTLQRPHHLHVQLVEGPLRTLEGDWRFTALGTDGCRIDLELDFDAHAGVLGSAALRLGFQALASRMVDDFTKAARQAHG